MSEVPMRTVLSLGDKFGRAEVEFEFEFGDPDHLWVSIYPHGEYLAEIQLSEILTRDKAVQLRDWLNERLS